MKSAICICFLALLITLGGVFPCWSEGEGAASGSEGGPARRLVSLSPGITEIFYALDAESFLVGVSRQCDYPVAAKLKPRLGGFNTPDLEKIAAAGVDLVIFSEQVRPADLEALAARGILSRVLPARSVEEVFAAIAIVGELSGRHAAAGALVATLRADIGRVAEAAAAIPLEKRPRVYLELDGPQHLYSLGRRSFMNDLLRLAGGRNLFAERDLAYFPVASEEIVRANPDVILIDHPFQYKVGVGKREDWSRISAVQSDRVYDAGDFDVIVINRPGPRIAQAVRTLQQLLYPGGLP